MSYVLLPPVAVIIFILAVFVGAAIVGVILDTIGRIRCWRRKRRWKKAAERTHAMRSYYWG